MARLPERRALATAQLRAAPVARPNGVADADQAYAAVPAPTRDPCGRLTRLTRLDRLVLLASLVAAAAYAGFGLQVYRSLNASAFDLAFFDQILWNTAHGRWFESTYVAYNFLGEHFEPLLLPLALPYRFGAGPQTLIVLQAAAAAAAALPLYAAARRLVPSGAAGMVAVSYLVLPTLQRGLDFGFHPDLFEPLAAFSMLAALLWRKDRVFLLCLVALLLLKEDAFLIVIALGWVALLRGRRRLGVAAIAVSVAYGALVLALIMPVLRHGAGSDLAERYGYLGDTPLRIAAGALLHPSRVIAHLAAPTPALAVLALLASLALLPLLAPDVLIAASPAALVALLSTHPPQRALDLQYGTPLLILATIAALFGLVRAERLMARAARRRQRQRLPFRRVTAAGGLAAAGLGAAVAAAMLRGPFPPERASLAWRFRVGGDAAALARVDRLIPADARLSAQTGLAPHLSQRPVQREFPRLLGAQYVILQLDGIRSSQSLLDGFDATAAALPALGYRLVASDGAIRLYRRETASEGGSR